MPGGGRRIELRRRTRSSALIRNACKKTIEPVSLWCSVPDLAALIHGVRSRRGRSIIFAAKRLVANFKQGVKLIMQLSHPPPRRRRR
ncbi:hypothetical protein MRB53_038272 [Persea americana]|nr:hypothetical protein MRB53_038272 [Persea americana]